MATIGISLVRVRRSVPDSTVIAGESLTSSGTSQASADAVPADDDDVFWVITASGGAVWAKFAAAPVAAAGDEWLIADGQTREWKAAAGDKVAVIDA